MPEVKVKQYALKPGVKHSYIQDGERIRVTGDGKGTVPLSDEQVANFRNKLVDDGGSDEAVPFVTADAAEAAGTGLPKNGASSGASGASSGVPEPATAEAAEATETDKPKAPADGKTK
jgi:hypothetical protein